ncbi:MAG: Asp-tRNA(Asn)/Glu-tRNA(Gln) amidotransferase subunit GatB [Bdellovibrionales bacterium]|nr:Asp-tRNA(Asn)/Glu-tRNA(Gln) amidotransferase subunit GatB [Bdellovibrionales bacterium]
MMNPDWEVVLGLEIHCQLATNTKIFCGCPARAPEGVSVADLGPNANTCPVCTGQPGALPVLNRKVVDYAIRAGLAMNCEIRKHNVFSRKNYFYPDLPKGYQISQFDLPICEKGHVDIEYKAGGKEVQKRIGITRIHMEEDAGKNLHMDAFSLVNLNRACVPLIEIVSEPDMRSAEEAGAYMRAVYGIVTAIGVCDGNMQEGNFRCDANVSVMPKGSTKFGTRAEIKNVNSFRFVEKAIEYEVQRQIALIQSGGKVVQETRLWDSAKGQTFSMRSKEEAHDYRYFPEPDLIPVHVDEKWIAKVKDELPELPSQKKARYVSELGLSSYDAGVLTSSAALAKFFEDTLKILAPDGNASGNTAKAVSNHLGGEVSRLMNEENLELNQSKIAPKHLAEIVKLQTANVISSTGAKTIIGVTWKTGEAVDGIVEREGLKQVSDTGALEKAVDTIIAANPGQVAEYRGGKDKLLGFFVGQAMKATGGKANPAMLQEIVKRKLAGN